MEKEIWKDIKRYEGFYQVSSWGRVRSLDRYDSLKHFRKGIILKQQIYNGYLYVGLNKNGKIKMYRVHRLVAEAFIPNPLNLPVINHKDEDKTRNNVENLEWSDIYYNNTYNGRSKRIGLKIINHPRLSKTVLQIDKNTNEVIAEFPSTMEVQRQLGYIHNIISSCCNGKAKSAYGYKWSFK